MLPEKWTEVHQNPLRSATLQCPSVCQISSRSAKRYTRKALHFLHPSVFWRPRGTLWATGHQSRYWCRARPGLPMCQISSPYDNLSPRYLLPKFIDFVESVAARQRDRQDTTRYDTIRYTIFTCAQKLTNSQLNLPQGSKQKRDKFFEMCNSLRMSNVADCFE